MRFKLSTASSGKTCLEIQASGNYDTLATLETYNDKDDALPAIELIRTGAASAQVVDDT